MTHTSRQSGFSLIELMVAMTIGILVCIALTAIYVQNSSARNQNERVSRQVESGRYAMQTIASDLQQAGYLAQYDPDPSSQSTVQAPPTTPADPCDATLATLQANAVVPVQGYYNKATNPLTCATVTDFKPNTDVLVVRRASTCVPGATNCDALATGDDLFQASLCSTEMTTPATQFLIDTNTANLTLHKKNCTTLADFHRYLTQIYYIAQNNNPNDGVPTLKRVELRAGAFGTPIPLAEGIQDLKIEYGLDTNGDGVPDVFTTDPGSYNTCSATTTPTCVQYWQDVVSAKIHILARNATITPGYVDKKTYAMGSAGTDGPYNDNYGRHVYTAEVQVVNTSSRRATQ